MWILLCAVLLTELSFTAAFPILEPVEDILIPFEDNSTEICRNVQCPKLRCSTTVFKEGDCCFSCDTSGKITNITSVQGPLQFGIRLLFTATYTIHVLLYAIM